jgi:hypothetical protein
LKPLAAGLNTQQSLAGRTTPPGDSHNRTHALDLMNMG